MGEGDELLSCRKEGGCRAGGSRDALLPASCQPRWPPGENARNKSCLVKLAVWFGLVWFGCAQQKQGQERSRAPCGAPEE